MDGFFRRDGGQSLVELALTLPLLVFAILGGADMARAFALQIAVENGSRAGAEAYAIDSTPTNAEAQTAVINEINRTPTANASASNVTVTKAQADGVSACVSPPTVSTPCFVSVRVQYPWSTIIAWPLVPNGGNFDRTTTMRTFY
ncbi:MAG TPA: TadE/TadG family type IV pilus assembly protein [Candidatus Limnocylindria bacterium]|nr:TadE/TadG family type IV pilus assembly protein [Candidatus Limnocylindria bacterium]